MAAGKEILRLRGKISAADVAEYIGVKVDRLRKWEERDTDPKDTGDVEKVEAYFGVSLSGLKDLKTFDFVETSRGTTDYKDRYIATLEKQNKYLEKEVTELKGKFSLCEDHIRDLLLLTHSIAGTNQDSLAQIMEKLKIGTVEKVTEQHRKANLASYSRMKAYLGIP